MDTFELEITGIAYGGNGVGRHEGRAIFVPYAIPGEIIKARIVQDKKRFALHGPAQALQYRIVRFMKDVTVADLVMPGRRIDVPLERVGFLTSKQPCKCQEHAAPTENELSVNERGT